MSKRSYRLCSDEEIAEMVRLYLEEGLGEHRIGKRLGIKRTTVGRHIRAHVPAEKRRPLEYRRGRIRD